MSERPPHDPETATDGRRDFLRDIVAADVAAGTHGGRVATRFPPEPNGYPHIGHAKSICLNFGIAEEFGGHCNLRFDDTNPETEEAEYAAAIQEDVRWLGYDWGNRLYHASDYFERLYRYALELIDRGHAYVDGSSDEEIRARRGTVTEPGTPSPDRDRLAAESRDLFRRMRAGEFPDGAYVLRARIDMAAENMKLRDPLLYRIRHAHHYRTGDGWPIYPMYDFAHCLSDSLEGITHSLCTLEFENNRALYDWILDRLDVPRPQPRQYEFARLQLSYTVLSKRKLLRLVEDGVVAGWDDPRMPTLRGLRRRGYTPASIRRLCAEVGVTKANSVVDVALLEHCLRDDLNDKAPRVLGVLRPIRLVLENLPEGHREVLDAPSFPREIPRHETRPLPFGRELLIERDDFRRDPPKGYKRLAPGRRVRLRHAYVIELTDVVEDADGEVTELRARVLPETLAGPPADGGKVHGTIHWVPAADAVAVEVRLYDRLFANPAPDRGKGGPDFRVFLNPDSLEIVQDAKLEPSVAGAAPGTHYQLERHGYFVVDPDSTAERLVLDRTVTLRDSWAAREAASTEPAAPPPSPPREPTPSPEGEKVVGEDDVSEARRPVFRELRDRHDLPPYQARVLAEDEPLHRLFTAAHAAGAPAADAASWIANELRGLRQPGDDALRVTGPVLAELLALLAAGTLTTAAAKEVLAELVAQGGEAGEIVRRRGLERLADDDLGPVVDRVLTDNPDQVAAYRAGKTQLLGFLIGKVMQATRGRGEPQRVRELLTERLR